MLQTQLENILFDTLHDTCKVISQGLFGRSVGNRGVCRYRALVIIFLQTCVSLCSNMLVSEPRILGGQNLGAIFFQCVFKLRAHVLTLGVKQTQSFFLQTNLKICFLFVDHFLCVSMCFFMELGNRSRDNPVQLLAQIQHKAFGFDLIMKLSELHFGRCQRILGDLVASNSGYQESLCRDIQILVQPNGLPNAPRIKGQTVNRDPALVFWTKHGRRVEICAKLLCGCLKRICSQNFVRQRSKLDIEKVGQLRLPILFRFIHDFPYVIQIDLQGFCQLFQRRAHMITKHKEQLGLEHDIVRRRRHWFHLPTCLHGRRNGLTRLILKQLHIELEHGTQQCQIRCVSSAYILRPYINDQDFGHGQGEQGRFALKRHRILASFPGVRSLQVHNNGL
mmetsp:Transcript_17590/g.30575  ORF Transcript_17590/g.30575 Transcript_17590/m.30575 type:complete len:392 (-) Transcript_17590:325-1500(-)